jgi:hypothetical protein
MRVRIYAVDGRPGLAAIGAAQKTAHFDGHMDNVRILRVKGNAFYMSLVGRSGKGPFFNARHLAQARQLRPAFAEIVAAEQMRGLGAGVNARFAIDHLGGKRIDLFVADAAIAPLPSFANIRAGVNLTTISPAEERLGDGLEDDRAEVLARNHRPLTLPGAVALVKREDAVYGADQ